MNTYKVLIGIVIVFIFALPLVLWQGAPVVDAATACYPQSTKQCISNIVYWYNSCGSVESVYQNCNITNQICEDARCVNKEASLPPPNPTPVTPTPTPTTPTQNQGQGGVSITMFASRDGSVLQWGKNVNSTGGNTFTVMLAVKNTSNLAMNNVVVKASMANLTYAGGLIIDTVSSQGDLVSGVTLGTLFPKSSKILFFTVTVPQDASPAVVQLSATSNVGTLVQDTDYITVTVAAPTVAVPETTGMVTGDTNPTTTITTPAAATGNSFLDNLKKNLYIWIIIAIILVAIFIIIFRKLSSDT